MRTLLAVAVLLLQPSAHAGTCSDALKKIRFSVKTLQFAVAVAALATKGYVELYPPAPVVVMRSLEKTTQHRAVTEAEWKARNADITAAADKLRGESPKDRTDALLKVIAEGVKKGEGDDFGYGLAGILTATGGAPYDRVVVGRALAAKALTEDSHIDETLYQVLGGVTGKEREAAAKAIAETWADFARKAQPKDIDAQIYRLRMAYRRSQYFFSPQDVDTIQAAYRDILTGDKVPARYLKQVFQSALLEDDATLAAIVTWVEKHPGAVIGEPGGELDPIQPLHDAAKYREAPIPFPLSERVARLTGSP